MRKMKLPDLSYMMTVAGLRYIQSIYEPPERRNPDGMVRELLSPWQRVSCDLRARLSLGSLRGQPFYYYVLSRTRYYDDVYRTAVASGTTRIINIGAGSDTRAYRFADELRKNRVQVLECDQTEATRMKERAARQRWRPDHVSYLPMDLNDEAWPQFQEWLRQQGDDKQTLVLLEGVSPYIDTKCFTGFLRFLARILPATSSVAYDFKLPGVNSQFGRSERTLEPFRLSSSWNEVVSFHSNLGYRVEGLETSANLSRRLVPSLGSLGATLFEEDALVQLSIAAGG
jgi:methyltransferase (TIGR00027 family)